MFIKKRNIVILTILFSLALFGGDFALYTEGLKTWAEFRGQPLIEAVTTRVMEEGDFAKDMKTNSRMLSDGRFCSNIWSEDPLGRFRQESVLAADGESIEISFMTYKEANKGSVSKTFEIEFPYAFFEGAEYEGYMINGRSATKGEGRLAADMPDGPVDARPFRFFCIRKDDVELIFDLMPRGPGDYFNCWSKNCIRGTWMIERRGEKLQTVRSLP